MLFVIHYQPTKMYDPSMIQTPAHPSSGILLQAHVIQAHRDLAEALTEPEGLFSIGGWWEYLMEYI